MIYVLRQQIDHKFSLHYVELSKQSDESIHTKIPRVEVEANIKRWDNAFVWYVLGDRPFYAHLKAYVTRL